MTRALGPLTTAIFAEPLGYMVQTCAGPSITPSVYRIPHPKEQQNCLATFVAKKREKEIPS